MSDNTFYEAFVMDMFKNEGEIGEYYGHLHAAVGVAGEAGEVLDLIKKAVFTGKTLSQEDLVKELGDIEFYLQALRTITGITRHEVLNANMLKLEKRHPEGFENSTYYNREVEND